MNKKIDQLGDLVVDFLVKDKKTDSSQLADALIISEGFSVKRAEVESREFLKLCSARDVQALRQVLESGIPTLRLYAARELARLGAIEAIRPLLQSLEKTRTGKSYQTYHGALSELIHTMTALPQPEHLPYYLDILRWQKRYRLPIKPIAQALTTIANTWPTPELQEALPFLKSYPRARQAIEATLLPGARFPIPAERPVTTENLPRPASEGSGASSAADQLPLPAESAAATPPASFWERLRKRWRR